MLEKGIAYRKRSRVNWCPKCATVLANEQVVDGCCWRHEDTPVEAKEIEQWFLRITQYADELLERLDSTGRRLARARADDAAQLDREIARHARAICGGWICRTRRSKCLRRAWTRFTARRPDSRAGASAAEPSWLRAWRARPKSKKMLQRLRRRLTRAADIATAEKEGFFTGRYAVNPFNGEKIPIWVGNFVLMEYGTGAVMCVPAHDERDFEFATKYGLAIPIVVQPDEGNAADAGNARRGIHRLRQVCEFRAVHRASHPDKAIEKMTADAEARGFGKGEIIFRLKDWGISRQRYWGTPIPVIVLREVRHGSRAGQGFAGGAAADGEIFRRGPIAAGERAGIREREVSEVRRAGAARNRHDGYVHRFVLVFLSLRRSAQ